MLRGWFTHCVVALVRVTEGVKAFASPSVPVPLQSESIRSYCRGVRGSVYDPLLEDIVGRHGHGRPDTDVMQFIKVFPVDQATYEKLDVVTELKKELAKQTGQSAAAVANDYEAASKAAPMAGT